MVLKNFYTTFKFCLYFEYMCWL